MAASSPFFQKLLGRNNHPHPLIYMRGIKSDDLLAIVDFLYRGETNLFQENLESFLAIAEELQLKGLKTDEQVLNSFEIDKKSQAPTPTFNTNETMLKTYFKREIQNSPPRENRTLAIPSIFGGDLGELEERVKSLMEKSQNKIIHGRLAQICKVCGKEGKGSHIRDHIEANHLEGIVISCSLCDKTFRSRQTFGHHKRKH